MATGNHSGGREPASQLAQQWHFTRRFNSSPRDNAYGDREFHDRVYRWAAAVPPFTGPNAAHPHHVYYPPPRDIFDDNNAEAQLAEQAQLAVADPSRINPHVLYDARFGIDPEQLARRICWDTTGQIYDDMIPQIRFYFMECIYGRAGRQPFLEPHNRASCFTNDFDLIPVGDQPLVQHWYSQRRLNRI